MSETNNMRTALTWVGGILGTLIAAGIIGILTVIGSIQTRLADIEATMRENREERIRQINNHDNRINRLEDERAYRSGADRERKQGEGE